MPKFGRTSSARLDTCDPKWREILEPVVSVFDITVLEGHRDEESQAKAVARGVSFAPWPKSAHNSYPSQAVDIAPYPVIWPDRETQTDDEYNRAMARFGEMAGRVKSVAEQKGYKIKWGGDFKSIFDGPHFELVADNGK